MNLLKNKYFSHEVEKIFFSCIWHFCTICCSVYLQIETLKFLFNTLNFEFPFKMFTNLLENWWKYLWGIVEGSLTDVSHVGCLSSGLCMSCWSPLVNLCTACVSVDIRFFNVSRKSQATNFVKEDEKKLDECWSDILLSEETKINLFTFSQTDQWVCSCDTGGWRQDMTTKIKLWPAKCVSN